jgi:hypothetical protein
MHMESGIFFIDPREDSKRKHVIQKIKRISITLNDREYWTTVLLAATLGIALGCFFYLLFGG